MIAREDFSELIGREGFRSTSGRILPGVTAEEWLLSNPSHYEEADVSGLVAL
jgi:hypothetical protein